ncbi:MAG: ATP-dependent helicase UvrD/PcrA [Acidimicrobiaceae bacterium]
MEADALLEGLNDAQRRAVTSDAAPLCILAGAGTGKTRVLTRRIAYRCATGAADPRHVIALTFTRKAAGELATRLRGLGLRDRMAAGTFHAIAYAQLRNHWADKGQAPPELLERKLPVLARAVRGLSFKGFQLVDVIGEIEWAKARLVSPARYAEEATKAGRHPPLAPQQVASIYERYELEKRNQRKIDFDDILWQCTAAIERDADFGAAQRWQFRHFFVDEFQDVNPLQLRLLSAWRGDRADLCVVGDPNQAIYTWNGADPGFLGAFDRHFPGGETVPLSTNYRSSPQVLATANRLLDCGGLKGVRLHPTRGDGPVPSVDVYADAQSEARAIARALLDRHGPGTAWSHQAVLVRTNAQTVLVAEACKAVNVPVRVRGQTPYLELPEVRDALHALQRRRGPLAEGLAALDAVLHPESEPGMPNDGDDDGEGELSDAELTRLRNLEELLRLAAEYSADDRAPTVAGLLAWLAATVGAEERDDRGDAVDVVTFHAAKGLEWPIVHVAGVEKGLVPITHAKTGEALDEERRLLYVAITRAERELRLSWAQERMFGTRTATRRPSPYLDDLQPLLDALEAGMAPADAGARLPEVRQAVRAARGTRAGPTGRDSLTAEADIAVFEDLKRWRAGRAKAANVPAYVVFDDKTLAALASSRPASAPALLRVPGIGPVKAERFGAEVLEIVERHGS